MWFVILLILCAGAIAYYTIRRKRRRELPHDTYVCDVCGQRECICHKEEETAS
jgi:aspartate carbamoyltransferase regulatory subunit